MGRPSLVMDSVALFPKSTGKGGGGDVSVLAQS